MNAQHRANRPPSYCGKTLEACYLPPITHSDIFWPHLLECASLLTVQGDTGSRGRALVASLAQNGVLHGASLTLNTLEYPNHARASFLWQVLEPIQSIAPEFFLKPKAAASMLARAEKIAARSQKNRYHLTPSLTQALKKCAAMNAETA